MEDILPEPAETQAGFTLVLQPPLERRQEGKQLCVISRCTS